MSDLLNRRILQTDHEHNLTKTIQNYKWESINKIKSYHNINTTTATFNHKKSFGTNSRLQKEFEVTILYQAIALN